MKDVWALSPGELEGYLSGLRDELEDVEEERMFVLGQTGLHVSASAVKKYDTEIAALKARIEEAERALRAHEAG
jgi:hypothetical protein